MRHLSQGLLVVTAALGAPALGYAQPAAVASSELQEVIVTAQKRVQRLQDVPIPVSVLGQQQMEEQGVEGTADLTRVVPGLLVVQNTGDCASVALYLDGVPLVGPQAGIFNFGYLERIEVLKGPQGTLFGRNATGGAINIITRTPAPELFAEAELGYGSFEMVTAKAYVTGPLTSTVRADFQAFYEADSGYMKNIVTGSNLDSADDYGFRTKLLWEASEKLSFTATADYVWDSNHTAYAYVAVNGNIAQRRLTPGVLFGREGDYEIAPSFDPSVKTLQKGGSLIADLDLGFATLKSISGFRHMRSQSVIDSDVTPIPRQTTLVRARGQTWSQEFIAASTSEGPLQWVTGLFLFKDKNERLPQTSYANGVATSVLNAAVRLTLIGGLRYSYEKKHLVNASFGALRRNVSESWDDIDYRLTAQYFFNPDLNVYLTRSTGFKSGSYNATSFTDPAVFPETVDAWTAGAKFARRGLTLSMDAFHYDWKDIQIQRTTDPTTGANFLQNAARAKIKGVEFEGHAALTDHLDANVGLTLMKGTYTDFPDASVLIPIPGGGNRNATMDASGNPVYRTPEQTLNAGLSYTNNVFGGVIKATGSVYYNSGFSWEPSNRMRQPAFTLINGRVSWSPESERFTVTVWGENLTDEYYYNNVNVSTGGDTGNVAPPRRVGITFSMKTN